MTDYRKVARAHGILDERLVDRRRFLAKLGAGALGATFLGLTDAGALADAFARPVFSTGGATGSARAINMIALGDSVMWGQGLDDMQKFQAKIASWIQSNNAERRQVRRWNFAHSGATIGSLKGMGGSHTTGQMTAAVFSRAASVNGGRGLDDFAEFEPRRLGDTTQRAPRSSAAGANSGRPLETSVGDTLGGEIPRTNPTLWRQLDLALETMRTGRDPRSSRSLQLSPANPEEMDLVLLNGGANDVDFLGTICNLKRNGPQTYQDVRAVVEPRMKEFLPKVLATFPNATFVLPTYYQGISAQSTPAALTPLVALVLAIVGGPQAVVDVVLEIPNLIARNDAMQRAITDSYRAAVAGVPAASHRIHIVTPDFGPQNGYGAPQSFLYHIEDTDRAENRRRDECHALFAQWAGDIGDRIVSGQSSVRADTPLKALCDDASAFHPNVAGANHYFLKIRDALMKAPPAFMKALPPLRVVVNGTTAGDRKTVTVTAFDAQSGQPVTGTVSIAGATGPTGAPISYAASACALEAGGRAEGGPAPGPAGRPVAGRAAQGRAPVRAAPAGCNGKVAVPGYSEEPFRY